MSDIVRSSKEIAKKSAWAIVGRIFVTLAVGFAGGIAGAFYAPTLDYFSKDRGHDIEMVKISLSLLSGENKESSVYGRRFALNLLEKFSAVEIDDEDQSNWAADGTITERGPWLFDGGGSSYWGEPMVPFAESTLEALLNSDPLYIRAVRISSAAEKGLIELTNDDQFLVFGILLGKDAPKGVDVEKTFDLLEEEIEKNKRR